MIRRTLLAVLLGAALAAPAAAQHTVFLVRHGERADTEKGAAPKMAADPDLSAAGRDRADYLATVLKDAGITAIYATEFKRTQQTAAPLARKLGLTVTTVNSTDTSALLKHLKSTKGNALIVGHSNTIPEIVKSLAVTSRVRIGDEDFDNLFVVTLGDTPSLIHLHYR
jgi:broad specificity phosphatase PhoE